MRGQDPCSTTLHLRSPSVGIEEEKRGHSRPTASALSSGTALCRSVPGWPASALRMHLTSPVQRCLSCSPYTVVWCRPRHGEHVMRFSTTLAVVILVSVWVRGDPPLSMSPPAGSCEVPFAGCLPADVQLDDVVDAHVVASSGDGR